MVLMRAPVGLLSVAAKFCVLAAMDLGGYLFGLDILFFAREEVWVKPESRLKALQPPAGHT